MISLRLDFPNGRRVGPGKVSLLRAIEQKGSIAAAAKVLGMSYPKALRLVSEMNALFEEPVVTTSHGGAKHGGAELTASAHALLSLYDNVQADASRSLDNQIKIIPNLSPI